ncbi:hypothetical protein BsWGS_00636 [Bradybaena similaris]
MSTSTDRAMLPAHAGSADTPKYIIPESVTQDQVVRIPWIMSLFIFFYSLIFLLGLTGNCLVAFVVMRNKTMQTITNIFITNLAISDILMCLLAVPFTPISYFLNSWIFGKALCHIVPMILCISVYVSTLTSTAIAVDRYFVIVYPFKPRMKVYMCVLMIFAVWVISVSISLPLGIYHEVENTNNSYMCSEKWPKPQARQFFTVTSLVLQYIVPCSIITFCYTMVSMALKKRSKVKIGSGVRTREREEMEIKRKKRTNNMLIAMVVIFVLCWMPLNMVHLWRDADKSMEGWYYFTLIFFVAHVIAMSSTIYNPFLYAWMNDNFKKEFRQVLPCLFFGRGSDSYANSYTQYTNVEVQQPSVIANRSPIKNGTDNTFMMKDIKAYYDTDSEKIRLNVIANNSASGNHVDSQHLNGEPDKPKNLDHNQDTFVDETTT